MDELKRFQDRLNLLWVSALGKEISIREIGEIWKYKTHIPLYKDKLPQLLVDSKLWKIVKIENREAKYLSSFDGYPEFVKIYPKTELIELFLADFDKFKIFLEDESIRKILFDINNVKLFFKNESKYAQKFGYMLPIVVLSEILAFLYFIFLREENKEITIQALTLFGGIHPIFNIPEYCQKVFVSFDIEEMKKWESLVETKFGKHITKQIGDMLKNPILKKLISSSNIKRQRNCKNF
jgi:hypothetical protein